MTIRHKCGPGSCYKELYLPDWGILDGCFPRDIKPSDIDGVVEINGHLLFLEWKKPPASLTTGQRRMFERQTLRARRQQVLVIYGELGKPARLELIQHGKTRFNQPCDMEFLRWHCEHWAQYADSLPSVRPAGGSP